MKKLTTLALAAGLIVAAAAPASAVDTKVDGEYVFTFARSQMGFQGLDKEFTKQRFRLGLTFTASENLSGYVNFQTAEGWGVNANEYAEVQNRLAYIDWVIPGTSAKVRMGKFSHGMPVDAFGHNQIMQIGTIRTGMQISAPVTEWMDVTAMWSRQTASDTNVEVEGKDNTDIFAASATMKFDGLTVSPWVVYSHGQNGKYAEPRGKDMPHTNGADAEGYYGGVTSTLTMFDPLTVKASAAYGTRHYELATDREGWYAQLNASYKTAFGTPSFGFWYGSGDDKDAKYAFQNWVPTTKGKFAPASTFFDNVDGLDAGQIGAIGGTWGLKLGIDGVSFLEGLTHNAAVVMINGANHEAMLSAAKTTDYAKKTSYTYLTWSDTVYEFDFRSTYQIYKNLSACLDLAYIINDLDEELHGDFDKNDWRAALSLKYKF